MRLLAMIVVSMVMLVGCGEGDGAPDASAEGAPDPTTSITTPAESSPTSTSSSNEATNPLVTRLTTICGDGLAGPDERFLDAVDAARAGTRSPSEIADAVRQAQDEVEALAEEASAERLPGLADALQNWADTLGRARVSGEGDLGSWTDAREAVNDACLAAAADALDLTPTG